MTTTHRATYFPALGGPSQGGNLVSIGTTKVSARDVTVHGQLKRRRVDYDRKGETPLDEAIARGSSVRFSKRVSTTPTLASLFEFDENLQKLAELDKDDREVDNSGAESSGSESSDEEMDQLRLELEQLKKERAAIEEAAKIDDEQEETVLNRLARQMRDEEDNVAVVRPWEDDAIFRGPGAKDDKNQKPSFINDQIRSEFHRRFLKKYVL